MVSLCTATQFGRRSWGVVPVYCFRSSAAPSLGLVGHGRVGFAQARRLIGRRALYPTCTPWATVPCASGADEVQECGSHTLLCCVRLWASRSARHACCVVCLKFTAGVRLPSDAASRAAWLDVIGRVAPVSLSHDMLVGPRIAGFAYPSMGVWPWHGSAAGQCRVAVGCVRTCVCAAGAIAFVCRFLAGGNWLVWWCCDRKEALLVAPALRLGRAHLVRVGHHSLTGSRFVVSPVTVARRMGARHLLVLPGCVIGGLYLAFIAPVTWRVGVGPLALRNSVNHWLRD